MTSIRSQGSNKINLSVYISLLLMHVFATYPIWAIADYYSYILCIPMHGCRKPQYHAGACMVTELDSEAISMMEEILLYIQQIKGRWEVHKPPQYTLPS